MWLYGCFYKFGVLFWVSLYEDPYFYIRAPDFWKLPHTTGDIALPGSQERQGGRAPPAMNRASEAMAEPMAWPMRCLDHTWMLGGLSR